MTMINRKVRVWISAATLAMVASGLAATPGFAQDQSRQQPTRIESGDFFREMRRQQAERDRPQQTPQRVERGNDRPRGDDGRDRSPAWRNDNDRRQGNDRDGNPAWRNDTDRRGDNNGSRGNRGWRDDDRRGDNNGWRGNPGWRDNDRRDDNRWRGDNRGNDPRWRDNDRGRNQAWNRNAWRRDNRYDWQGYRDRNRNAYRIGRYYAPYNGYSYRRLNIGLSLGSMFYGNRYWINDPWQYRLPSAYGSYRWVRYYDDVVLVDTYSGRVVDVIYDFFW